MSIKSVLALAAVALFGATACGTESKTADSNKPATEQSTATKPSSTKSPSTKTPSTKAPKTKTAETKAPKKKAPATTAAQSEETIVVEEEVDEAAEESLPPEGDDSEAEGDNHAYYADLSTPTICAIDQLTAVVDSFGDEITEDDWDRIEAELLPMFANTSSTIGVLVQDLGDDWGELQPMVDAVKSEMLSLVSQYNDVSNAMSFDEFSAAVEDVEMPPSLDAQTQLQEELGIPLDDPTLGYSCPAVD